MVRSGETSTHVAAASALGNDEQLQLAYAELEGTSESVPARCVLSATDN